ncbi:MAG: hypothetical protein KC996_02110 [Phycisphaerales bacterium]|nr:hypothetical protein [Phycisphaerales bacterium]
MSVRRPAGGTGSTIDSVTIQPGWVDWEAALSHPNTSEEARADRAMLELPTDGPVVMSGHQPIVFHPGIASKLAALMVAAEQTKSGALWVVPDQDAVDPLLVRVPEGRGDSLRERTVRLGPMVVSGVASASLPSVQSIEMPLPEHLEPLRERLLAHAGEPTLARQVALATIPLAAEWLGVGTPTIVFASELMRTHGVRGILDAIERDAHAAVDAYNDAVRAHGDAGVRPLLAEGDRVELPLWRARRGSARVVVFADELGSIPEGELLPRGLVMTGGARRTLGELFIHGTGGWAYDKITERWLQDWLGEANAPIALVSATQRLDLFDGGDAIDPEEALWRAHHARHDPGLLGDDAAAAEKQLIIERINETKGSGGDPSELFAGLQRLLQAYRSEHADELAEIERRADNAKKHRMAYELAMDRTWPFVNFDRESGLALTERVRSAMGG